MYPLLFIVVSFLVVLLSVTRSLVVSCVSRLFVLEFDLSSVCLGLFHPVSCDLMVMFRLRTPHPHPSQGDWGNLLHYCSQTVTFILCQ